MNKEYKNIDAVKTGKFIRELRESHNWTQEQLGDKIFISRKSISKWETGRCCPSIDMLKRLSEALGVTFDDLIAGEFVSPVTSNNEIEKNIGEKKPKILLIVLFTLLLVIISILLSNSEKDSMVFSVNYEDEYFTISNGILVLNSRSYINLGNIKVNVDNIENHNLDFKLYIFEDDEEYELLSFNGNAETKTLVEDSKSKILRNVSDDKIDKLYLKVSYTNNLGEETSYKLHLSVERDRTLTRDVTVERTGFCNNQKNQESNISGIEQDDDLDLSFLFMMSSEKLKKCANNVSISINGDEYSVSYTYDLESGDNYVTFSGKNSAIQFFLNHRRIFVEDNYLRYYVIEDDNIIRWQVFTFDYNLVKNTSLSLRRLCESS